MDTKRQETFSYFIDSINYEKNKSRKIFNNKEYVKMLFNIFSNESVEPTTSRNWLGIGKGKNTGFIGYFYELEITPNQVDKCLNFFKKRIGQNLNIVQDNLKNYENLWNKVNLTTSDEDEFFYSLINEFLFIVKPSIDVFNLQNPNTKMSSLFCTAITENNIAFYIDDFKSLLDSCYDYMDNINPYMSLQYLNIIPNKDTEALVKTYNYNFSNAVHNFMENINSNILYKFNMYQNETTYKLIKDFYNSINTFTSFYSMLSATIAKEFSSYYVQYDKTNYLYSKCEFEIEMVQNEIAELETHNNKLTKEQRESLELLKNRKTQLNFLISILFNRDQMCSIFSELTDGKSLLIHTND